MDRSRSLLPQFIAQFFVCLFVCLFFVFVLLSRNIFTFFTFMFGGQFQLDVYKCDARNVNKCLLFARALTEMNR